MQLQSVQATPVYFGAQPKGNTEKAKEAGSQKASSLEADIVNKTPFAQGIKPLVVPGLGSAGAGLATGAIMGGALLPVGVGKGLAYGGGFGTLAGLAAGVSSGIVVNKYIDNRLGATAAGAGLGALSGAIVGLGMSFAIKGDLWMNAGFMAVPGLVAGAVGGFVSAQAKR